MKVLLHQDVDGLGYLGDVVDVADGYARNYLLPQRLAVQPTQNNIKAIEQDRARQAEVRRLAREQLVKVAEGVNGTALVLEALANEQGHLFGSITDAEIAKALQDKGFEVQRRQVRLAEHLRLLGQYEVELRFAEDIGAKVQLEIVQVAGDQDAGEDSETAQ